jgi:hypothetical protein
MQIHTKTRTFDFPPHVIPLFKKPETSISIDAADEDIQFIIDFTLEYVRCSAAEKERFTDRTKWDESTTAYYNTEIIPLGFYRSIKIIKICETIQLSVLIEILAIFVAESIETDIGAAIASFASH